MRPDHESEEVRKTIFEIEAITPFQAYGFWKIERSTLVSLTSTILTYLIILYQFSTPTHPESDSN